MAEIDHAGFAQALRDRLLAIGYSLTDAERQWPLTDRAMLSRAINGKQLSAGNFLLLCEMAGFDPYAFLDRGKGKRVTRKTVLRQTVTRSVSRETPVKQEAEPCI